VIFSESAEKTVLSTADRLIVWQYFQNDICLKVYILKEQKRDFHLPMCTMWMETEWVASLEQNQSHPSRSHRGCDVTMACMSSQKHFINELTGSAVFNLIKLNATREPLSFPALKCERGVKSKHDIVNLHHKLNIITI